MRIRSSLRLVWLVAVASVGITGAEFNAQGEPELPASTSFQIVAHTLSSAGGARRSANFVLFDTAGWLGEGGNEFPQAGRKSLFSGFYPQPGDGTREPNFLVAVNPTSRTVVKPKEAVYTLSVAALDGFYEEVTLTLSGLPEETYTFDPCVSGKPTVGLIKPPGEVKLKVHSDRFEIQKPTRYSFSLTAQATRGERSVPEMVVLVVPGEDVSYVSLEVPNSAVLNNSVLIHGRITPTPPATYTVTPLVKDPAGSVRKVDEGAIRTRSDGTFEFQTPVLDVPGDWTVSASWSGAGNLPPAASSEHTLRVRSGVVGCAILIAGLDIPGESVNLRFTREANKFYSLLLGQGFLPDDIYYLSPYYGTAEIPPNIACRGEASRANAEHAFKEWAPSRVGPDVPLVVYLADHGIKNPPAMRGRMAQDNLTATMLAGWLMALRQGTGCEEITVIYDGCYAGTFISLLHAAHTIVVTSSNAERESFVHPTGEGLMFSTPFFNALARGKVIQEAFDEAVAAMRYALWWADFGYPTPYKHPQPQLDDPSREAGQRTIGLGLTTLPAMPQLSEVSVNPLGMILLAAGRRAQPARAKLAVRVAYAGEHPRVQASIVPPAYTLPPTIEGKVQELEFVQTVTLGERGGGLFEGEFSVDQAGTYAILIDLENTEAGIRTLPYKIEFPVKAAYSQNMPGLRLMSIPLREMEAEPAAALSLSDVKTARWVNGEYRIYPADPYANFRPPDSPVDYPPAGIGYWSKTQTEGEVRPVGVPAPTRFFRGEELVEGYRIRLNSGWNMIGNPFLEAVHWDLDAIRVTHAGSGETKTLRQAQKAGWVEDYAWGWEPDAHDATTGQYRLIFDESIQEVEHELRPWQGYWIKARQACELLLNPTPPAGREPTRLRLRRAEADDWRFSLVAQAGKAAAECQLGVAREGRAFEQPPAAPGASVEIFSLAEGRGEPLAVDLRSPSSPGITWELAVRAAEPRAEVMLTWPDLRTVPGDYTLTLVDEETGQRRAMRTTSYYRFTSGEGGRARRFRVEVKKSPGEALAITSLQVRPARGGGLSINYVLSREAGVWVKVSTLHGQVVAYPSSEGSGSRGTNTLVWDGCDEQGRPVPNGVYLCEVTAQGEDGELARAVRTIRIDR
jgi:hypothetical protein